VQLIAVSEEKSKLQGIGVFLTGMAAAVALLYFGRAFCITLIVSIILAFLLEPFVGLFMRARLPRGIAALLVCVLALIVVYLTAFALFTQLASFTDDLPEYSERLNAIVDRIGVQLDRAEANAYKLLVPKRFQPQERPPETPVPVAKRKRKEPPPPAPTVTEVRIHQERSPLTQYLANYASSVYNTLLMMSFVPFLVYFMLSWRDHISRSFLSTYEDSERLRADRNWRAIADMARAYVVGNVILGIIISVVSCAVFWTWHLPYWVLVGFLSGFLSLIPYVGLPLALIPPVVSALMIYDGVTPYLIICAQAAAIHLLALNLLYPAVVGARVHLNPLTVTVALMFWGSVWGGIGLVLAIPVTAALKVYMDSTDSLQGLGRLLGDRSEVQAFAAAKR